MKRFLSLLSIFLLLLLSACGETEQSNTSSKEKNETKGEVSKEDFAKMYSDPKKYKGYSVEFTGQVFTEPEKDEDGTYLQIFAKPENGEQNILVGVNDPDLNVKTDDYVSVKGIVSDIFEGENLMGGAITAPVIKADSVEVVDYITAVSPTVKSIEVNKEINQHDFIVTVQKIELAENQTRLYLKVQNNTSDAVSLYASNVKLIVGNKQLEEEYNYETNLPEVQSDLLAGVETEGVITFPAIDTNITNIKINAEGYSDNYDIDIKPFTFDINVN